ncbi:hypothetical protein NDU88_000932 [Pleurodeles waltl]|uniref:Uncharacterized protein n=1 Tax=Pleurodeles waltl TaxID=8319 RepID=A0AAV7N9D5_PLEWA|nr:hypothetical protein NDU88_000932 [Pleurodeles waltl]
MLQTGGHPSSGAGASTTVAHVRPIGKARKQERKFKRERLLQQGRCERVRGEEVFPLLDISEGSAARAACCLNDVKWADTMLSAKVSF